MAEFWSNPGMEPKRIYRWVLRFATNDPEQIIQEWLVKRATRPSWSVTESTHQFINHTFYYPGRVEYDEMSITLIDAINPNGAVVLRNILTKAGYILPSNAASGDYSTISKAGYVQNAGLGTVELTQLTHDNQKLETFVLHNAWIKNCNLNEVNYESDDLLNIDITLRYDYFTFDFDSKTVPKPIAGTMS